MSHAKIYGLTKGVHHVGLTVADLEETRAFFVDTLGFSRAGELPEYPAAFVTDGTTMITLWQATDPSGAIPFDRKNVVGLHHLALTLNGDWSLGELRQRLLEAKVVAIELEPELLLEGPAEHMICTIPGGLRIEFVAYGE